MSPKLLSCLFQPKVLCSFVKTEKFVGIMDRCLRCEHYESFLREMHEEDMKEGIEVDEINRLRARYERGEISLEEFRKGYFSVQRE